MKRRGFVFAETDKDKVARYEYLMMAMRGVANAEIILEIQHNVIRVCPIRMHAREEVVNHFGGVIKWRGRVE